MTDPKLLLERIQRYPPAFAQRVEVTPVDVEHGRALFTLDAGPQYANPMGTVHGGVLSTLADSAMGIAYASTLAEGESFTTLELKINFLKPVWTGLLTAEARVVKGGKSVGLITCDVTDADGSLVAYATSTCMTLRSAQANGRGLPSVESSGAPAGLLKKSA